MNILILGSGGRENTFAWKISKSSSCGQLYICPGNAGTSTIGRNINISLNNFEEIKTFVLNKDIEMVIVGPEDPLVDGIYDFFKQDDLLKKISVIGPSKKGAKLEGSKKFAKEFMHRHAIPTAKYKSFNQNNLSEGFSFLESLEGPYVLKADGLAGGKGVVIISDIEEAKKELSSMILDGKFGVASNTVIIEEFLDGIEMSVFILTDGESYKILPSAKDYKQIGENNTGLNTGGMGAISPVPFLDRFYLEKIENEIIKPTISGLKKEDIEYVGFIFFGLINVKGEPKVIEYNVRMGDPETEVVIPRIKSDLLNLLKGIKDGTFSEKDLNVSDDVAATVMLTSSGYPEEYSVGHKISGLDDIDCSIVFHAGTKHKNKKIITSGGRVMSITSFGKTMEDALKNTYESVNKINFEGKYYRKDIGFDL
tara:strand:- start:3810 stop:5081 length:1272 start_codon:yes stop_codon:yes gene_type:complete